MILTLLDFTNHKHFSFVTISSNLELKLIYLRGGTRSIGGDDRQGAPVVGLTEEYNIQGITITVPVPCSSQTRGVPVTA